tara:strand:- start:7133 stop:7750 length:618 start_codon:yes stop_codon:yes gene_type:complete
MTWSGNELRAQVTKASRGLGFDWGRAKYLGESVLRAERHGLPATQTFIELADGLDTGPSKLGTSTFSQGAALATDAVDLGITLVDHLPQLDFVEPIELHVIGYPLFLGIVCYGLTGCDRALYVETGTFQCVVQANLIVTASAPPFEGACHLSTCSPSQNSDSCVSRFELESAVCDKLNDLASRVYAPATEASRLAGAGAGLNDND